MALVTVQWTKGQWKAVCAAFRVFERQIGSRCLQYVSVQGVAAAAGVSQTTARAALNKLFYAGMLRRVGDGSRMYQPRFTPRARG